MRRLGLPLAVGLLALRAHAIKVRLAPQSSRSGPASSGGLRLPFEILQPPASAGSPQAPPPPTVDELLQRKPTKTPRLIPPPVAPHNLSVSGAPEIGLFGSRPAEIDFGDSPVSQSFQPSGEFQAYATEQRSGQGSELPNGVQSPVFNSNSPIFRVPEYPFLDIPKWYPYSLENGNTLRSYSRNQQDLKLITQVFKNITSGFFLDTNAWEGEVESNTLLFELLGWRGLLLEPRSFMYINLWSKFRKAWLFLGSISPKTPEQHKESGDPEQMVGFDKDGNVDQLSGHKVPTYVLTEFLKEMGGRKTIDFWTVRNGGYEPEVLNATFNGTTVNGTGQGVEFGVIMVSVQARLAGRGCEFWVSAQTRDEAEQRIFEILVNMAGFKFIGGLDPRWVNTVVPRYRYYDWVFVNCEYFYKRGLPCPSTIKSAPPDPLPAGSGEWNGWDSWDPGYTYDQEVEVLASYIELSQTSAAPVEIVPRAIRADAAYVVGCSPAGSHRCSQQSQQSQQ